MLSVTTHHEWSTSRFGAACPEEGHVQAQRQSGVDVVRYSLVLTNQKIMSTKAYALDLPPKEGEGLSAKDELWKRYEAWFIRDWPLADTVNDQAQIWTHVQPPADWSPEFWATLGAVQNSIRKVGLLNPVLVTWKNGSYHLHPGKCRAWALKNLGIDTIPAIVCWYHGQKPAKMAAEYEIRSAEQLKRHFVGDIAPEMTRRGIRTPKKR